MKKILIIGFFEKDHAETTANYSFI